MDSSIFKKAGELLSRKSKYRHWQAAVAVLSVAVIGTTAIVLSQPAQTMTKEAYCGMEEHAHGGDCYERVLICGYEEDTEGEAAESSAAAEESSQEAPQPSESGQVPEEEASQPSDEEQVPEREAHQHDDSCYAEYVVVSCGEGEAPLHQLGCYAGAGMLICGQEESADHIHADGCYGAVPVKVLACGQEESEAHTHSEDGEDSCYIIVGAKTLVCGMEESEEHAHTDECYELIPGESFQCMEGHIHTESCYPQETEPALICGLEEQEAHTHIEECYTVTEKEELICGQEASEEHEHTAECYNIIEEKELTCGKEETEGHAHTEQCYSQDEEKTPVCGREEKEVPPADAHVHTIACCETERVLICGKEEYIPEESPEPASEETAESTAASEAGEEPEADPESADSQESVSPESTGSSEADSETVSADSSTEPESAEASEESGSETDKSAEAGTSAEESSEADGTEETAESTGNSSAPAEEEGKHVHTDACYEMVLVCGLEEHAHTDECHRVPYCGIQAHHHMAACYDEEGNVICGLEEHTHEENCYKEPHCGITAHTHAEECYDENGEMVCGMEEHTHGDECFVEESNYTGPFHCQEKIHQHSADCYDEENNLICGLADYVVHTHADSCYDEDGELICPLPEIEEHAHSAQCYDIPGEGEEAQLVCGKEEAKLHTHTEDCCDEEGKLTCGMLQAEEHVHSEACLTETEEAHVHTDSCYDEAGNLICGYEEAHTHTEGCYDEEGKLICGFGEETEKLPYYCDEYVHEHSEECYDENQNLICGKADFVAHVHREDCYNKAGELVCPLPEIEAHTHSAACYSEANGQLEAELICGKAEDIKLHTHTEECYDADGKLICGKLEVLEHVHGDVCHVKPEAVEDITYYCQEMVHEHSEGCYNENGELICGEADYAVHTHTEKCYGADEKLICPLPEVEVHTHTEECYDENGQIICGKEEAQLHTHTEECYDENGAMICGQVEVLEHIHSKDCEVSHKPITKIFQGGNFVVTATYKPEANLPEEAELIAEQITAESNESHYAEREAEYQEVMGNKKASMRALLKIGFYVDGVEVEPEVPVTITVQFMDENGLEEGSPITVVHFGEEGTEVLDGSDAEDGKTTFEMNSFSELAIGYGKVGDVVTVPVSDSIEYKTDTFNIKFHIEGDITVPVSEIERKNNGKGEDGDISSPEEDIQANDGSMQAVLPDDEMNGEGNLSAIVEAEELEGDLFFTVKPLDEESEEYNAVSNYAMGTGTDEGMLSLQVLSYSLVYAGEKLELDDCVVTVEIAPTEALVEYAEEPFGIMAIDDKPELGEMEIENEVLLMALDVERENENLIVEGVREAVSISKEIINAPVTYEMNPTGTDGIVAHVAASQANPEFTVKYYATLDIVKKDTSGDGNNQPIVINTDTTINGRMPENKNMDLPVLYLSTEATENGKYKIAAESTKVEVYKEKEYQFIKAPGLIYVDSLAKNDNYKLVQIKKCTKRTDGNGNEVINEEIYDCCELKCSEQHTHTKDCYEGEKEWYFTNKSETKDKYPNDFILIEEGAVLELIYVVTTDTPSNGMYFYDYDISDGKLYADEGFDENGPTGEIRTRNGKTHTSGSTWYMYTDKQGINSLPNQNLGFGNSSSQARTTLGETYWDGNLLNRANNNFWNLAPSYGGCTFGLTTKLKKDGTIQYAPGVVAPNLFNEGAATGKTEYIGSLTFDRSGDTYTLTATTVTDGKTAATSKKAGLTQFTSIPNWNNTRTIWTNSYYPLDEVSSAGGDGHDLMFGEAGKESFLKSFAEEDFIKIDPSNGKKTNEGRTGNVPTSDDKGNHNHYFGMWYTVEFDLTEDYIGPLEYIFYGDDDMWVFLDGNGKNVKVDENGEPVVDENGNPIIEESSVDGKLICDIGGVHSAVGEYVNLWNYIKKGTTGHYTLSFFYTERGASGSTCWMQFTLPSVSFITPKQTTGQLQVEKEVTGAVTEDEFGFKIKFYADADKKTPLMHNYSYEKVRYLLDEKGNIRKDENGNPLTEFVSNDVLIWDGACFTLKANESILISYIPDGAYFEIIEVGPVIANKDGDRLKYLDNGDPDWEILDDPYVADITGGLSTNQKTVTGRINLQENKIVKIHYNNIKSFELPETGGSGTIPYTVAGTTIILFGGAGLMYRKKFRERRG